MKTYKSIIDNETIELIPVLHRYANNILAIELLTMEKESYAVITVNLPDVLLFMDMPNNYSFVDINNCPWAENFILEHELGIPTGEMLRSGFVLYPLYEFNLKKLNQYQQMSLDDYN